MATRAQVETVLINRCGALLADVDRDGTTVDGTNPDLNDPLGRALRKLGYTVADITAVTSAEVEAVETDALDALLDLAELRVMETVAQAASGLVDITLGPRSEKLSQLATRLDKAIERKRGQIEDEHGELLGDGETLEGGTLTVVSVEDGTNIY